MKPRYYVNSFIVVLLITLPATAQAIADCTVSADNVAFGNYSFLDSSPREITGNIQVSCSLIGLFSILVGYEIILSSGNSGNHAARTMTSGANQLQYNLFTDPLHLNVWGDGNAGTLTVTDGYLLGLLTTVRNYPVYGMIPVGQNLSTGIYSDTIMITVNY